MFEDLTCYLVGGAVRDELLGRPVKDRDWVVVGATVKAMQEKGFTQVGRDFPVFLHPQTKEEYALARTERKAGQGHQGFEVFASAEVTLEEDLARRDLTVNAMARDATGGLIDPFGGERDLADKVLRHVSEAFAEDPLRVLRVARFSAQLGGFTVADETRELMSRMCAAGELRTLSAERVWQETERALGASDPAAFFKVLSQVGGFEEWFPELENTIESGAINFREGSSLSRFVDLKLDAQQMDALAVRLKIPGRYIQAAQDAWSYAESLVDWQIQRPEVLAQMFESLKVHHNLDRLNTLRSMYAVPAGEELEQLADLFRNAQPGSEVEPGPEYGKALRKARLDALQKAMS